MTFNFLPLNLNFRFYLLQKLSEGAENIRTMIKKMLKDNLPFSVKRYIGKSSVSVLRFISRTSRAIFYFSDKFIDYSRRHGFYLERELPPTIANLTKVLQSPALLNPFGVSDFLALSEQNFTAPEIIESSIIIPVFNKAEYTFQCLRSLVREVDLTKNEIIIVDNASTDETARMLAQFGNRIRVIRNAENLGFVEACNAGAKAARGKYVVFLNNDTIVQPVWLSSMVETIEADELIGAVGSMLIFPDGKMQEAGGIVWNDATARLYGYGEHPEDLRFNFSREVDYCSGASLLVPKDFFDSLGGFDMRYAPAYYEDTDLCMSVRAANRKVVFQPRSRAIHFEGVTAGRDLNSGFKRFQEINREKFFDKWREVLERDHLPPAKSNIEAASNRGRGQKIVVVFSEVPKPDTDSGNVRMFAILKFLAKNYRVVLVPLHKRANDIKYERELGNLGVETVWIVDFDRKYGRENFDFVMLCYPHIAYYVYPTFKRMFPRAKFIFDTVDVHFVRLEREYELTRDKFFEKDARRYKRIETILAKAAEQVWCVTETDKENLQTVAPEAKIEVVPNIHTLGGRGKSFVERRDLLFIGNFFHRPNTDAVYYFLDEIFPLVLEKIPTARFRIVGNGAPPEIFALSSANVLIEGFVPNVEPLFESCRVFVAPLRYGAGMKGKIGQALSFGLPTVTTSIGAEGMNLTDERQILIADEPEKFAEAVARLYESAELWQTLSDNGFRFIKDNFSPPVIDEKIRHAIEKIPNTNVAKR